MDASIKPDAVGCTVPPARAPRLLDRVRAAVRLRHYSFRTEECYVAWIRHFILFHNKRHSLEMAAPEINAFLTDLAVRGHVAASTQNQAFSALLFLYQKVLEVDPGRIEGVIRACRPVRLPVVLTRHEVNCVLAEMRDPYRLIVQILYGSGLRLLEALQLRVQDVDFVRCEILVRHGKGGKDRRTVLSQSLVGPLQVHLDEVRERHQKERACGRGQVRLPEAFERKAPSRLRPSPIGAGNGCSRRIRCRWIRAPAGADATISMRGPHRARSAKPAGGRG
jgi:integrase